MPSKFEGFDLEEEVRREMEVQCAGVGM